jgi:hypothetical protein
MISDALLRASELEFRTSYLMEACSEKVQLCHGSGALAAFMGTAPSFGVKANGDSDVECGDSVMQ